MASYVGFRRGARGLFRDARGNMIYFVTEPEVLLQLPQNALLFDAFAGCFTHRLAARFAELLGHFDQYCFEPEDRAMEVGHGSAA